MTTKNSQALATVAPTEQALQALRDAGIDLGDQAGKDQIDSNNLVLPFLAICQKTSPQLESDNAKYIEGLKFLDLFNSLTGENFGSGPVMFIPLALREHAIEFLPFAEGGGIKDRDVPLNDPRCDWGGENKEEKPVATKFMDWAVLILPSMELIVLSFKSTSLKQGGVLKTLTKNPRLPLYAQVYAVSTASAKNNFGTFGVFGIKPAGVATPEQALKAKQVLEGLSGKTIVVEHEAEPDETRPQAQTTGDNVPF